MNISLKQLSITISILLLGVVFYDFFVLNEYHIETGALIGISTLLCLNIFRNFNFKIKLNIWILVFLYVVILFVGLLSFYILLLSSFGFGFTGRTTPWNHIFAVILNLALMIVTIIDFQRSIIKKK